MLLIIKKPEGSLISGVDIRCDAIDMTFDRVYIPGIKFHRQTVKKDTTKEMSKSAARNMI